MKVQFRKRFLKQLAQLPPEVRLRIEDFVFNELTTTASLQATGKCERMQGYPTYYKARFSQYRVGFRVLEDQSIELQVVLHRKEIYRYFP